MVEPLERAARALKGLVKVGAVQCDVEKALCGKHGVKSYPTVKLFSRGGVDAGTLAGSAQSPRALPTSPSSPMTTPAAKTPPPFVPRFWRALGQTPAKWVTAAPPLLPQLGKPGRAILC